MQRYTVSKAFNKSLRKEKNKGEKERRKIEEKLQEKKKNVKKGNESGGERKGERGKKLNKHNVWTRKRQISRKSKASGKFAKGFRHRSMLRRFFIKERVQ